MPLLQFQPLSSQPTPAFWTALTTHKLDTAQLDDSHLKIRGWIEEGKLVAASKQGEMIGIDGGLTVGGQAFGDDTETPPINSVPVVGILKNFNTIEDFRKAQPKKAMFDAVVNMITDSFSTPEPLLNPFLLVTFADLKKYIYHYWFAFPALVSKPAWEIQEQELVPADPQEIRELRALQSSLADRETHTPEAFLAKGVTGQRSVSRLSSFNDFFAGVPLEERTVAFHDASSSAHHPGWQLRNILFYLRRMHGIRKIRIICLREGSASRQAIVTLPSDSDEAKEGANEELLAVGWERTAGKLSSQTADLGPVMDPVRLAAQAVDLNLKLMKWRVMPRLDLDKIAATKCLLLGAGTLGCYVARNLMGWGIRQISLVDSGRVSFSNPVRQPLFTFDDCLNGGKEKAQCAAERLKEIFPEVKSAGHALAVPMPGHPFPRSLESRIAADVGKLEELISAHDVVFLLMDSRESRWLPSVIAAAQRKLVINAALGFDSYLVMRHGVRSPADRQSPLGCYYCNDVVAPMDSLTDRTLDQMCTVTRPGVAPMAAATAVELMITVVQHPLGHVFVPRASSDAPARARHESGHYQDREQTPFDHPPHQIRGSLGQWNSLLIQGASFGQCVGCSNPIVEAYRRDGISFVKEALTQPKYLEQMTGLDLLHEEGEAISDQIDWTESDEDEGNT